MASKQLSSYSPYDVSVIITRGNLSHTVTGFAEDSFITVAQAMARWDLYTGGDNTNTRIHKNNTSATISLSLQQTSASNDIMTLLHKSDVASRDSSGLFTVFIRDNSGRSFFHAEQAYIAVVPSATFGTTMQTREWEIHAVVVDTYLGGNQKIDGIDQAAIESLGGTVDSRWQE